MTCQFYNKHDGNQIASFIEQDLVNFHHSSLNLIFFTLISSLEVSDKHAGVYILYITHT